MRLGHKRSIAICSDNPQFHFLLKSAVWLRSGLQASSVSLESEEPNAEQHAGEQWALEQARQRAAVEPSAAAEQAGEQRAPRQPSEEPSEEEEPSEHDCSANTENWMETWSLEKCLSRFMEWALCSGRSFSFRNFEVPYWKWCPLAS